MEDIYQRTVRRVINSKFKRVSCKDSTKKSGGLSLSQLIDAFYTLGAFCGVAVVACVIEKSMILTDVLKHLFQIML